MQPNTKCICFGPFLNLIVSQTSHLSEMIFWIYVNNTKQHLVSETDETLYILKLFNVKIFWKKKQQNTPTDKHDGNFII